MNYTTSDYQYGLNDLSTDPIAKLDLRGTPKTMPLNLPDFKKTTQTHSLSDHSLSPAASSATSIRSSISLVQPTSSYWHIPDRNTYLTSIAAHETNNLCAIGSGSTSNNLFIYEVYPDSIIHHQTVSLPEITTLQWASPKSQLGQMGNVLISGHKTGVAHLTLLPDAASRSGQNAEILKRYNHVKHLPALGSPGAPRHRSVRIKSLELTHPEWRCCSPLSLLTLCGDHIFLWEPNRSDVPLVMQKSPGTNTLGMCTTRDGVYALGRKKGVSIRDIRIRDKVNSGLKPPVDNDESVSMVKWNQFDGGNQLAAVHDHTTIKIWDIRHKKPLATYNNHLDNITGLDWSARSELVSASADGTVRVWDTSATQEPSSAGSTINTPSSPTGSSDESYENSEDSFNSPLEAEVPSPWHDYRRRLNMDDVLEEGTNDLLQGVPPINHSKQFKGLTLTSLGPSVGAMTIDTDGYLGIHDLGDSAAYPNASTTSFDFML